MPLIEVSSDNNVTFLTLNRDDKRNAFNEEMSEDMMAALHAAEQSGQRAVVIQASDDAKIWSAGHDLTELVSVDSLMDDPMFELFHVVAKSSLPIIAKVHAPIYAGALHLIMVADIVLATPNAPVIMTANKMGVPFNLKNYSHWLRVMSIHKAKELFFTALPISAEDAYNAGIYNHVLDKSALDDKLNSILDAIRANSAMGIADTKLQLNTLTRELTANFDDLNHIEEHRREIFQSQEFRDRIQALIDKIQKK